MPREAVHWLADLSRRRRGLSAEEVHRALALLQVCRAIDPALVPATEPIVADLIERDLAFAKPDLFTGVLSAVIAAAGGVGEAQAYLGALAALAGESEQTESTVVVRLVFGDAAEGGTGTVSLESLGPRWFRSGSPAAIDRLLGAIEVQTRFGTRPALIEDPLATIVEGASLVAARNYDLLGVARCLRACSYAGAGDGFGCRAATDFLLGSRRPDGSFGFYETPASILERRGESVDSPISIQLAVTMQVLWALAELADPGWRLLENLQPKEGACSTPLR